METQAQKRFFIFIGRSGCGKGTQAELLKSSLEGEGVKDVTHITTGGGFREFITRDGYISSLSAKEMKEGGLQPEFLAVWNWSNIFINTLKGGETILLDGAPRKPFEVKMLHSVISFLGYEKPVVVYVNVSESWAKERLMGRGRADDIDEANIALRMGWFETEVLPTFEEYLKDPRYTVLHINGEQPIEDVHKDIVEKLNSLTKNK